MRLRAWAAGAALLLGALALLCGVSSGRVFPRSPTRARPVAWLSLYDGRLLLHVDARGAHHPLRIDPLIQQGEKLTAGGEAGEGLFGASVALSADGDTALVGAPSDDGGVGAAWVFTRTGSTWSQQGGKLTGAGERGRAAFGTAVALSGDGDTAVIGGPSDGGDAGAAWVFTRSGATWTQLGEKLTGGGESGGGAFGRSVALSSDGSTAVIGGPFDAGHAGAAWVFTRAGATWSPQGEKLTGHTGVDKAFFGYSVALSADGDRALVGGHDYNDVGAVWAFARSGATWKQTQQLAGGGEVGFGAFGSSVALSSDGSTALIGGQGDDDFVGAAWVFASRLSPIVSGVRRRRGPQSGGVPVTITGANFTAVTGVSFGSDSAASFSVDSTTSVVAVPPPEPDGRVDVTVTTANGTSAVSAKDRYSFTPTVTGISPDTGSAAGGALVTVTGAGFVQGTAATSFRFGFADAAAAQCISATVCTVVVPAHEAGTVHVTAAVSDARSPRSGRADRFVYD